MLLIVLLMSVTQVAWAEKGQPQLRNASWSVQSALYMKWTVLGTGFLVAVGGILLYLDRQRQRVQHEAYCRGFQESQTRLKFMATGQEQQLTEFRELLDEGRKEIEDWRKEAPQRDKETAVAISLGNKTTDKLSKMITTIDEYDKKRGEQKCFIVIREKIEADVGNAGKIS